MVVKVLEKQLKSQVFNINGRAVTSWDIYNQMLPYKNTVNESIPVLTYMEIYNLLKTFGRHLYIEQGLSNNKLIYVIYLNMNLICSDNNFGYKPVAYTDNTKDLMEYLHNIWCIPLHMNNKKPETLKEVNNWIRVAGGGFKTSVLKSGIEKGKFEIVNEQRKERQEFKANSIEEIIEKVLKTYPFILKTWIE